MAIQLDGTTGISTSGNIIAAGTLTVGIFAPSVLSASGNVTGGNLNTAGALSVGGNSVITGDLTVVGNASLSGNIIGDKITNGTTSVEIPVANGNVNFTIGGSTNVVVVTATGGFVTGVVSATGNITGSNLNAAGLSLSSNVISALNSTSAITTSANVSANNFIATNFINSSGNISGANLTASGSMSAIGNATAGNILTPGVLSASGNIIGANISTIGLISATGNIIGGGTLTSSGNITAPGVINSAGNSQIQFINTGNLSANIILYQEGANGNVTVRVGESATEGFGLYSSGVIGAIGNLTTIANIIGNNISSTNIISAAGNITGSYFLGNGSQLTGIDATSIQNGTSNVRVVSSGGNVAVGVGGTSNVAVYATTGEYVTGLISASGNIITTANISGGYILGNGSLLTGIDATSIQNGTSNVRVVSSGGNVAIGVGGTSNVAVYATTGEYVTGVVSASGNITGGNLITGNILATGIVSAVGNLISNTGLYVGAGATSSGLTNPIIVAEATGLAYIQVAAKNTANTGSADMVTYADNGSDTQAWTDMGMTGSGFNDTAYTITNANDGYVFVQGNSDGTGGNLVLATGSLGNAADIVFATGGFLDANEKMRFVHTTGQFWIETTTNATSTTSGALRVAGGAGIAGNVYVGGLISATGNVTGGNLSGTSITGSVVSASGTITGGNLATSGTASASGNITGANILTGGLISATGNITGGNILGGANVNATSLTGTTVSVSGNVTGGNIVTTANITGGNVNTNQVVGTSLTLVSTGNLILSATGNIDANNEYINNVPQPVQDGDAVNKLYVDGLVTTGFAFHQPVYAATNTTLDSATGGTVTYAQPNGAGNGIGATLTTTGSFNLIDTANIQTIGTRVLVKDQANAVQNGVYTWANSTVIVRSTDADEYGADSATAIGLNDYFFVQAGNVNAGAAYIVSAPTGTITFGTSNITFAEFSKSQVYTANTSAGISLNGTVINALVDNVTTAFSSGNIVVKTSAQLTTPNIGAATGTSLSTTGNVTGGNINTSGVISATGNITGSYFLGNGSQLTGIDATSIQNGTSNVRVVSSGGNVTVSVGGTSNVAVYATTGEYITGLISASGNVTGGNITTGGLISATGNITSAANVAGGNLISTGLVTATSNIVTTANVSGGNVLSSALIQGVTLSASGNVNGGNITTAGSVSAVGNLIGGNITTGGLISSTGNITSAANIAGGNLIVGAGSGGNLTGANVISATTLSASANVIGGNITTAGLISATGNITGGNVLGGANVNATTHTGTSVSITGTVTAATVNAAAIGNAGAALTGASISAATIGNASAVVNGATVSITGTVTAASVVGGVMTGSSLSVSGAVTGGAITGSSLTVGTGTITGGNIVNGNGNGIGNIGSSTVYFNTVFGKATTAQYADLAENYAADAEYTSGTVLEFGGANEVTLSMIPGSARVAGVVSTNPAHLMNSTLESQYVTALALTGRVPTSVVGTVRKGDMMVSAGNGTARACATPAIGTVIGKAIENFNGESGVIEIVVGRL